MNLDEYQLACGETANYPGSGELLGLLYTSLGLAGESGELCDKVKKVIRDSNMKLTDERREALVYELGDVLWYVARTAHELGITLSEVARLNIDKLSSMKERGKISGEGDNR